MERIARVPSDKTLEKYGLTPASWLEILNRQGGVCAVCRKLPKSGRLNVDHDHVRKFKKLSDEEKRKHVRGLLCYWCNRSYVGRCITIEKSRRVTEYLENYAENK